MKYDVVTFGSATLDIFMRSSELKVLESEEFKTGKGICVPLGSKLHIDDVNFEMGGCGTNASVTFANQGMKTAYFGRIGDDWAGKKIESVLEENGVSLDLLKKSKEYSTAVSVILSSPGVGRSILEKYGACHELSVEDVPDQLETSWIYIASLSHKSHDMLVPLIALAKKMGIKVSSNPAGSMKKKETTQILREVLDGIDILILNQEETAELTGIDFKKEKEVFKKLDEMVRGIAVMTKGPEGVVVSDGKKIYRAGIPKSDMVERTGAGDAFGSAFTVGYMETGSIEHAIQLGTANATAVLQKPGATNGLLKKGDWGPWEKVEVEVSDI